MEDLKKEYLKFYLDLISIIQMLNSKGYSNENAKIKLDYISKAIEVLEKYSKLS